MNFVFISPGFPKTYYHFCESLQKQGVNVLAIGDVPYDELSEEVKHSVKEYYYVETLEDYDALVRAMGYFIFHYGRIDWLESNNEYWLESDARLRTDFNITTGLQNDIIEDVKHKSRMKEYYAKAHIPTARYILVSTIDAAKAFIDEVAYPVIAKPDSGMGAQDTHKINNEEELVDFFEHKADVQYIMEEFVEGVIESFDGIASQNHDIIFETSHVFPDPLLDVVSAHKSFVYYSQRVIPEDLKHYGEEAVKVFPVNGRCFHMEFFRLTKDKPGLANKGDVVGLEVNMRMPGGYTPDMMNWANDINVYDIYADMVTSGESLYNRNRRPYHCVYAGRRDEIVYHHTDEEIKKRYHHDLMMVERMPDILSDDMGNDMYTARFETMDEVNAFIEFVLG